MIVAIEGTHYIVFDKCECCDPPEVCVLQIFEYADGIKRQKKIWTKNYKEIK